MLRNQNKIFIISLLIATSFISSYKLLIQTYDHRTAFAQLEKLTLEKEDLSFQSNILIERERFDQFLTLKNDFENEYFEICHKFVHNLGITYSCGFMNYFHKKILNGFSCCMMPLQF